MNAMRDDGRGCERVKLGDRVVRTLIVASSLGLLAGLSFVFLPPGEGVRDVTPAVGRPSRAVVVDRSPLQGVELAIPDVQVRRLERVAVVTFSCDVFDGRQELRGDARARLLALAKGLERVRGRVAVEVAGYAPDARDANGYSIGLLRAARVAGFLTEAARLPPAAVALRSLADTEIHGPADRPHSVVIMISSVEELALRAEGDPVALL